MSGSTKSPKVAYSKHRIHDCVGVHISEKMCNCSRFLIDPGFDSGYHYVTVFELRLVLLF